MIIGNPDVIAFQLEQIFSLMSYNGPYGTCNFIIKRRLFPGKGGCISFYMLKYLKNSLDYGLKNTKADIGKLPIDKIDFSVENPENLIVLDADGIEDYGFYLWLGFDGNEERLIYTQDHEKTWQEERFPKGTVENLIRALPDVTDLVKGESDGRFITTLKSTTGGAK